MSTALTIKGGTEEAPRTPSATSPKSPDDWDNPKEEEKEGKEKEEKDKEEEPELCSYLDLYWCVEWDPSSSPGA